MTVDLDFFNIQTVGLTTITGIASPPLALTAAAGFSVDTLQTPAAVPITFAGGENLQAVVDRINTIMSAAGSDPIAFIVGLPGGSALQLRGLKMDIPTASITGSAAAKLGFTQGPSVPLAIVKFLVKITDKGVMPGGGNWEHTYTYQTPNPINVSTLGENGTAGAAIKAQIRNQILPQLRATRFITEINIDPNTNAPKVVDPVAGGVALSVKDLAW